MQCIQSFNKVCLEQRSIVFCDIDDTVLNYGEIVDNYWKSKIYDPGYNIWHSLLNLITPSLTNNDFYELLSLIDNANSEIHFITARNPNFSDITNKHMNYFNLSHIKIHFLNGKSKGNYINNNWNLESYNKIIFIDDSLSNISDVLSKVKNVHCYHFLK
jgi:hydroxymethylpyrimidine pyrophosphatase-like HAD family hydrolase